MIGSGLFAGFVALGTFASIAAAGARPAGAPGAADFDLQCAGCHSLKPGETRVGPSLYGIYGKPAGRVEGFGYSVALKKSKLRWNAETLDRWLADSGATIPGSTMYFRQGDAAKRKAIVKYLSSQKTK